MLVLLYYLSQNENFAESVKPLMCKIKDSEEMLRFLNDLSKFSQGFGSFKKEESKSEKGAEKPKHEKTPQSPTTGIADEFIQTILDEYLQKNFKG